MSASKMLRRRDSSEGGMERLASAEMVRLKQVRKERLKHREEDIQKFHEKLRKLDCQLYERQGPNAILAIVCVLLGVVVNEVCVAREDYMQEPLSLSDIEQLKADGGRACSSRFGNPLKIVLSILTAVHLAFIVRQWKTRIEIKIERQHMEDEIYLPSRGRGRESAPIKVWIQLFLELCLCALHPIPYVRSYWEYRVDDGDLVFYRFESAMVALMMLRLYHIWRWLYLAAYYRFLNLEDSFLVHDYTVIEKLSQNSADVSRKNFPLKVMVSMHPGPVIALVTFIIFFSVCYLVRICEGPAFQTHSDNWWDQMWITITQGTTGYGGSTPFTQLGRFCAVVMMLLGPLIVSFVTATTTKNITLSQDEGAILRAMQYNKMTVEVLKAAASIVQFWWRQKKQERDAAAGVHSVLSKPGNFLARTFSRQNLRPSKRASSITSTSTSASAQRHAPSSQQHPSKSSKAASTLSNATAPNPSASLAHSGSRSAGSSSPGSRLLHQGSTGEHSDGAHTTNGVSISQPARPPGGSPAPYRALQTRRSAPDATQRPPPQDVAEASGRDERPSSSHLGSIFTRIPSFRTIASWQPWEEDAEERWLKLCRSFYMAVENYERFLTSQKQVQAPSRFVRKPSQHGFARAATSDTSGTSPCQATSSAGVRLPGGAKGFVRLGSSGIGAVAEEPERVASQVEDLQRTVQDLKKEMQADMHQMWQDMRQELRHIRAEMCTMTTAISRGGSMVESGMLRSVREGNLRRRSLDPVANLASMTPDPATPLADDNGDRDSHFRQHELFNYQAADYAGVDWAALRVELIRQGETSPSPVGSPMDRPRRPSRQHSHGDSPSAADRRVRAATGKLASRELVEGRLLQPGHSETATPRATGTASRDSMWSSRESAPFGGVEELQAEVRNKPDMAGGLRPVPRQLPTLPRKVSWSNVMPSAREEKGSRAEAREDEDSFGVSADLVHVDVPGLERPLSIESPLATHTSSPASAVNGPRPTEDQMVPVLISARGGDLERAGSSMTVLDRRPKWEERMLHREA